MIKLKKNIYNESVTLCCVFLRNIHLLNKIYNAKYID